MARVRPWQGTPFHTQLTNLQSQSNWADAMRIEDWKDWRQRA